MLHDGKLTGFQFTKQKNAHKTKQGFISHHNPSHMHHQALYPDSKEHSHRFGKARGDETDNTCLLKKKKKVPLLLNFGLEQSLHVLIFIQNPAYAY